MRHTIVVLRGNGNLTCHCDTLQDAEVFAKWLSRETEYVIQVHGEVHYEEHHTSSFHKGVQLD